MTAARWVAALALAGCATTPEPAGFAEAARGLQRVQSRTGDLRLSCSPPDATVSIDGVPVGMCSDFEGARGLSLGDRARRLEVKKTGFMPYASVVQSDGTRLALTVSLAPSSLEGAAP